MAEKRIREYDIIAGPFQGTYGSVSVARHSTLGTRRAIKRLHPHVKGEVIREEALKQKDVRSPYVVQIYDFFEQEKAIVMEYCPTGLDQFLKGRFAQHNDGLPFDEARELLHGILQGLNDAHAVEIVHGDIKPANVRFGVGDSDKELGLPKLSDFGAARRVRETTPGVRGSTNWMAPEVIEGSAPTKASDYFSFGVLAYLILSGRHPYYAGDVSCLKSEEDNITDVAYVPPQLAALGREDIPRNVADLVMELLSRDQSAREVAERELKAALADLIEVTTPPLAREQEDIPQPSGEELSKIRAAYEHAREWFFVRYRPKEAVDSIVRFFEQFDWQRYEGQRVGELADCWSLKGFINNSGGLFGEAVEAANNGLAIDPEHVNSLHVRGYAYTQQGEYDKAKEDLEKALELAPSPAKRRQIDRLLDTVNDRTGSGSRRFRW